MTSSIFPPRTVRGPWAPSTHATASTRFDLPDPLGPTTTVTPGSNSSTVLSANDLKPRRVSDLRNTRAPSRTGIVPTSNAPFGDASVKRALPNPEAMLPDRCFVDDLDAVHPSPA